MAHVDQQVTVCGGCTCSVSEPYIRCTECPSQTHVYICLHCFARGYEFDHHQSNHSYEVIKNDFVLLEENWTAAEDLCLLQAIIDCGLDNWQDIAYKLPGKTAAQCKRHYNTQLVENWSAHIPEIQELHQYRHPAPVPMRFCENPPRPSEGSTLHQDMSGYMAARGDFLVEQSNYAEMELREIDFSHTDTPLEYKLKCAVVDVYQGVLRERQRRKRIIRDHGLINAKKMLPCRALPHKYPSTLHHPLLVFMHLTDPHDWLLYQTGLNYEVDVKHTIRKLQGYREAGIKRLHSARVHDSLAARRQDAQKQRLALSASIASIQSDRACEEWLQKQGVTEKINKGIPIHMPPAARRSAPPLHIIGLPGYDKLSETEKKLCAMVRLVPESFLEFKRILVAENKKHGYLRLAQARTLIKIDVNKTRKLYDFLVKTHVINKEPQANPSNES